MVAEVPDWRTLAVGARVRVALWLHTEVGVGGVFTKSQLRQAFPNVEQIDRRMRDLRPEGWVFLTYQEDRSLSVDELRLRSEGGRVWEPGYRSRPSRTLTAKDRQAIFAADNYACVFCGVSGGEPYPDAPLKTAKLALANVTRLDGDHDSVATVCDLCHSGLKGTLEADDMRLALDKLDDAQRYKLRSWISQDRRAWLPEEALWVRYRRQPLEERLAIKRYLDSAY